SAYSRTRSGVRGLPACSGIGLAKPMDAMRSPRRPACLFLAMCLAAFSCGPRGEAPPPSSEAPAVVSTEEIAAHGPVQIEMKNVRLHMDEGIALDIGRLRGEMR